MNFDTDAAVSTPVVADPIFVDDLDLDLITGTAAGMSNFSSFFQTTTCYSGNCCDSCSCSGTDYC